MYKICTLFLVLISLAALATCEPNLVSRRCKSLYKITSDELTDLKKLLEGKIQSSDRKLRCYTHCLLAVEGFTDANGKLDIEKISKSDRIGTINERVIKIATECRDKFEVDDDDECEYPFQVMACITRNMMKQDDE